MPEGSESANGSDTASASSADGSDASLGAAGPVAVAGSQVAPSLVTESADRPHVVIVADDWGANWGERAWAVRAVAGALALRARVSVVSLDADRPPRRGDELSMRYDGIFPIYSTAAPAGNTDQAALVRASLLRQSGAVLPEVASRHLLALESRTSSDTLVTIVRLVPDVVLLAGLSTFWLAEALPVGADRPRIVELPLAGDDGALEAGVFRPLLDTAEGIGTFSDSETSHVRRALPAGSGTPVRRLHLALAVNQAAATSGLAGMASFGRFVVFISSFPPDDAVIGHCPPHAFLTEVLGVSVAEIRRGRWLVSDRGRRHEVVFSPNRMNAWRLMAHAIATVDTRPSGPIGREALESMLFGTPVVVPEGSVAAEHAAASNGGLWYESSGQMLDAASALVTDQALRDSLGAAGRRWATRHHGDMQAFVEDVQSLVLGDS